MSFDESGLAEVLEIENQQYKVYEKFSEKNLEVWDQRILEIVSEPSSLWYAHFKNHAFHAMEVRLFSKLTWNSLSKSLQERALEISLDMTEVPAGTFEMGISENTNSGGGYISSHNIPYKSSVRECTFCMACIKYYEEERRELYYALYKLSWFMPLFFVTNSVYLHGKEAYTIPPKFFVAGQDATKTLRNMLYRSTSELFGLKQMDIDFLQSSGICGKIWLE